MIQKESGKMESLLRQMSYKVKQLVFYDYGLCGVVFEDDKYIWCHQDYPMGGDKPHNYFFEIYFDSIDELVEYVKKRYHLK